MINNLMIRIDCKGRTLLVNPDNIRWVQGARKSVTLYFDGESCVLRNSLESMEAQLICYDFVRIHRCTIVNVSHIRELRQWFRGTLLVFLQDGTKLLLSKSYRSHFLKHLRRKIIK
jgi:two-component system LytT family response regulator